MCLHFFYYRAPDSQKHVRFRKASSKCTCAQHRSAQEKHSGQSAPRHHPLDHGVRPAHQSWCEPKYTIFRWENWWPTPNVPTLTSPFPNIFLLSPLLQSCEKTYTKVTSMKCTKCGVYHSPVQLISVYNVFMVVNGHLSYVSFMTPTTELLNSTGTICKKIVSVYIS